MTIDKLYFRELRNLVSLLAVIALSVFCYSCSSPRNISQDTDIDYADDLKQMRSRMDSLLLNVRLAQIETNERLSNLRIENITTYLSMPDSVGKQYPTFVSKTTADKSEKEAKVIDAETVMTIQNLVKEVSDLRNQLTAAISDKEKVVELSWWDLNRDKVYCVVIIFSFFFVVKLKKGG